MIRCASRLRLVAVFALSLVSAANAAPRIVVGELKGDKRSAFTHQVSDQLCAAFDCVPARGILAKQKVNWKAAKRAKVVGIFTGAVTKTRKGPGVLLILETRSGAPTRKWTLLTRKGKLSKVALRQVADDASGIVGVPAESAPVVVPPPAPEVTSPATPEPTPAAPAQAGTAPTEQPESPASASVPHRETKETSKPSEGTESQAASSVPATSWLALEAGFDFLNRNLSYSNLTSNNLRTYSAPLIVAPHVHAEVFPLGAGANPGILGGLGLEADFAFSLGLKSATSGDTSHPTSYSRLDVDLTWRLPVGSVVTLAPYVGYRAAKFSVGADANGNVYSGLPNFTDNGVVLGVGADFLLSDRGFRVLARLDYLPKVSGGDLLSSAYFTSGSASGLDVALGLNIPLISHLDLRVMGLLTRYGYSFTPNDTYAASGASDVYLGGRATLRYAF